MIFFSVCSILAFIASFTSPDVALNPLNTASITVSLVSQGPSNTTSSCPSTEFPTLLDEYHKEYVVQKIIQRSGSHALHAGNLGLIPCTA